VSGYYRRSGRSYGRSARPVTAGPVARVNKRPGACRSCGEDIPAGVGRLYRESDGAWSVVHVPAEWSGSPASGAYIGGCPESTDKQNAGAPWNRDGHVASERVRLAAMARTYAAMNPPAPVRGGYYTLSSGARVTGSRGRCEDAPCCGCCEY